MKKITFVIFLFCAVSFCNAQDTAKNVRKHSISFTGGVNIGFPISSDPPGTPWGGPGLPGAGPWFSLAYSYLFHPVTKHFSWGLKSGAGFAQYDFVFPGELINYNDLINEAEIFTGLFSNLKISKKIGWYNELDLCWSGSISNQYTWPGILSNLPYGYYSNLFFLYQTGISFCVSKHLTLTPLFAVPVISITARYERAIQQPYPNPVNAYSSARTGLLVSFNF